MSNWVGYAISVNCGEPLGSYQGTIVAADGNTITLTKAFRNGFPYPKVQVTLNAADIRELRIIEARAEPAPHARSTVPVNKPARKGPRATVCEALQAPVSAHAPAPAAPGEQQPGGAGAAAEPASLPAPAPAPARVQKNNNHAGRGGERARRRNEACFGDGAEPAEQEFDFEGNLALFDKRALAERLRHAKPDLLRGADERLLPDQTLRPDQTVLAAAPPPAPALRLPPALRGAQDYVTDEGLLLASATPRLRARLWAGLRRLRLLDGAHALLARGAADLALRLVGGGRRLHPRNAHQAPVVVALAGPHDAGAAALTAARLLASHGARAAALLAAPVEPGGAGALARELAAAPLAGVALAGCVAELPAPDLVLLALHDPERDADEPAERHEARYGAALRWAAGARAAALALEPPARGWSALATRAAVLGVVPAPLAASLGRVFLADVAPPPALFAELGLGYRAPFGAASLLPLHPADD